MSSVDTLREFQRLFAYDAWANREVLASIRKCAESPPRLLERMAHILSAEQLWLERILGQEQTLAVWPSSSIEECALEAESMSRRWHEYIAGMSPEQLEQTIKYKNSKGELWHSKVRDILTHVVMHSVYHRGQIASGMRDAGCTPAYTDFIHGVRKGLVE